MAKGLSTFVLGKKSTHQTTKESNMTFCGHNKGMADGVNSFVGGLVIQTKKRAGAEKVSVAEIPAIEIAEIDALLTALNASPKKDALAGVMAVGSLIRFFYAELGKRLAKDSSLTVDVVFQEVVEELNRNLFAMEEHYYENLRSNFPRLEAIRKIKDFLETQMT